MIPLVDLNAQHQSIREELDNAIDSCINGNNFIRGLQVSEFEVAFARYLGTKFCIGCGNGTDALEIIMKSLKIGPGDEVIVPSLTWISTAEAVSNVGAEPVFADIAQDFTIDYLRLDEKITPRTRAIIPVHLYGCSANMPHILKIADKHGLFVVEDCAQAHGAEFDGKKTGTFGIASSFSFFPSKNLGAMGDGGAIVTNDPKLADSIRRLSNHGQLDKKHSHMLVGRNSRLDTIQASILNVKLKYLDDWNRKRIDAAGYYFDRLSEKDSISLPYFNQKIKHVFHLFVIRTTSRDRIIKEFDRNNIGWGIHYPLALPFTEAYSYKNAFPGEYPESSRVTNEILSIPIYPEIKREQQDLICDLIISV